MVRDMWETRDRPLLEAIAEADERGRAVERVSDLNGVAGLSESDAMAGVKALFKDGLIDGADASSHSGFDLLEIELTGDGRRAVGSWPTHDPYADLIRLLEDRIAAETDPTERKRLQSFLDSARSLGESFVGSLLATLIARQAGL